MLSTPLTAICQAFYLFLLRFTSAIGWYTNALVTDNSIYVPAFSDGKDDTVAVKDEAARAKFKAHSSQPNVVSINTLGISDLYHHIVLYCGFYECTLYGYYAHLL